MTKSDHLKVAIIAGHGGTNPWKEQENKGVTRGDLVESELTLKIANHLFVTTFTTINVEPILIRDKNEYISLAGRGEKAKDCNLVISIHINAGVEDKYQGADCFYWPDENNNTSKRVAYRIARSMPPELRSNRIWSALDPNWPRVENVLKHHNKNASVVLIECGYATHKEDREFLLTPYGLCDVVNALRAGIIHFWRLKETKC